ncbi:hypothetical protein N0V83_010723, partial [Neocucurbitaria cava]
IGYPSSSISTMAAQRFSYIENDPILAAQYAITNKTPKPKIEGLYMLDANLHVWPFLDMDPSNRRKYPDMDVKGAVRDYNQYVVRVESENEEETAQWAEKLRGMAVMQEFWRLRAIWMEKDKKKKRESEEKRKAETET